MRELNSLETQNTVGGVSTTAIHISEICGVLAGGALGYCITEPDDKAKGALGGMLFSVGFYTILRLCIFGSLKI